MRTVAWFIPFLVMLVSAMTLLKPATEDANVSLPVTLVFLFSALWLGVCFLLSAPRFARLYRGVSGRVVHVVLHTLLIFVIYCIVFAGAFMASQGAGGRVVEQGVGTDEVQNFWNCLYFSIVTASTTGYGHLYPMHLARLVACSEILLVPVMIAGLVREIWHAVRPSQVPKDISASL